MLILGSRINFLTLLDVVVCFTIDISPDFRIGPCLKGHQGEQNSQKPLQQEASANAGTGQHSAHGEDHTWVAKMALFIIVKSSLSSILFMSGRLPLQGEGQTFQNEVTGRTGQDNDGSRVRAALTLKGIRRASSQISP